MAKGLYCHTGKWCHSRTVRPRLTTCSTLKRVSAHHHHGLVPSLHSPATHAAPRTLKHEISKPMGCATRARRAYIRQATCETRLDGRSRPALHPLGRLLLLFLSIALIGVAADGRIRVATRAGELVLGGPRGVLRALVAAKQQTLGLEHRQGDAESFAHRAGNIIVVHRDSTKIGWHGEAAAVSDPRVAEELLHCGAAADVLGEHARQYVA
mmetsp:Transcript_5831/g.17952  ORF Transcript_5831/g.17952 Transcript_5831/m.17952 type:complete len:211 (+) Transcript_5831:104-736(+)|eukprot:scaffold77466_cov26-Tisochrysis_lutea.AAC.6